MNNIINEDKFFPLSAVNHYSFCPRRCALIHSECLWGENYFTANGKELHKNVDAGGSESRRDVRIARSLRLFSSSLSVSGVADLVEFHRNETAGVTICGWDGRWLPYPIEYKLGSAKDETPYRRQLCAQAICLEEMFHVQIPEGALFMGVSRQRQPVVFETELRRDTRNACIAIHLLLESGQTPPAQLTSSCKSCSLVDDCFPKLSHRSARAWLEREFDSLPSVSV